ncbi:hypothetical protein Nepgr_015429 [Nepenthes gracilis]|uniref:Uncharacterized protein n=1 Tax=Nepenthes gracilis TaxID=150966 RepID=A0AAD3XQP6_NEPGR|nr:hypothetical protein Nepgr_015429 [Nepenthes gracilis]
MDSRAVLLAAHCEGVNYCCDGDDDGNPLNDPPAAATFDKTSCRKRPELRFHIKQKESFLLDDTASSPLFTFKGNCLAKEKHPSTESSIDSSLGFSATHFQGRSSFQEPLGFLRSPQSGNKF